MEHKLFLSLCECCTFLCLLFTECTFPSLEPLLHIHALTGTHLKTWKWEVGDLYISECGSLSLSLHLSPPWYSFLWLILLYWPPWKSNISAELKEINSLHWGSSFLHLSLETLSRCKLRGNYTPYLICCSSPGDPALPVFQNLKTFVQFVFSSFYYLAKAIG